MWIEAIANLCHVHGSQIWNPPDPVSKASSWLLYLKVKLPHQLHHQAISCLLHLELKFGRLRPRVLWCILYLRVKSSRQYAVASMLNIVHRSAAYTLYDPRSTLRPVGRLLHRAHYMPAPERFVSHSEWISQEMLKACALQNYWMGDNHMLQAVCRVVRNPDMTALDKLGKRKYNGICDNLYIPDINTNRSPLGVPTAVQRKFRNH